MRRFLCSVLIRLALPGGKDKVHSDDTLPMPLFPKFAGDGNLPCLLALPQLTPMQVKFAGFLDV